MASWTETLCETKKKKKQKYQSQIKIPETYDLTPIPLTYCHYKKQPDEQQYHQEVLVCFELLEQAF